MTALPDGRKDFLRIPPFPGAKRLRFAVHSSAGAKAGEADLGACIARLRALKVGGTYWGAWPELPARFILNCTGQPIPPAGALNHAAVEVAWPTEQDCDPWFVLERAEALVCRPDDELRVVAAIIGVPVYLEKDAGLMLDAEDAGTLLRGWLPDSLRFEDPFDGASTGLAEIIELSGHFRRLIDSNRDIVGEAGIAFWKLDSIAPLLWNGSEPLPTVRSAQGLKPGAVAVWRSKAPVALMDQLERAGRLLIEVEDGFLRSNGLGADCIPPMSITLDRLGAYFDPAQPSELEMLLQDSHVDQQMIDRARQLRHTIVSAGLGKYENGSVMLDRLHPTKRHVLVPGQVEDDRSVMTGGGGMTNLDLLRRVRAAAPEAYIIYKPHPDVLAGHRRGDIPPELCNALADTTMTDAPISSLIDVADEVHVNTSQAGFEALMRGKPVTTYGVPFYAGWGLTDDRGPVPERRTARRSLDELVAATLLIYPRYLDPVSGLPCPAEVVVRRLTAPPACKVGPLVTLRRAQGRIRRRWQQAWQ